MSPHTAPVHRGASRPAPAPPGDQDLATRLRVAVTRLHRRLRQQSLAGLSPAQVSALGSVNRLGTPTLGELAEVEQVQPPTVTRLVSAMESAGLVKRFGDPSDGRVTRVRITPEGRRSLLRIRGLKNAYLERRLGQLDRGEQQDAVRLVALLERLVEEP